MSADPRDRIYTISRDATGWPLGFLGWRIASDTAAV